MKSILKKHFGKAVIMTLFLSQVTTSQRIVPSPVMRSPIATDRSPIKRSVITTHPSLMSVDENSKCLNLASNIQSVVLSKLRGNALKTPVFGRVSGPLIDEIATSICPCAVCSNVKQNNMAAPNVNALPRYVARPNVKYIKL